MRGMGIHARASMLHVYVCESAEADKEIFATATQNKQSLLGTLLTGLRLHEAIAQDASARALLMRRAHAKT